MENFIIEVMNNYGYLGIILLITLENVFPPIPSELILTFSGFMTQQSELTILGVIVASTIGSLLGAIILYFIGKLLHVDTLIKFAKTKYGKMLRLKVKDIKAADKWFDEKGNKTVFFCRCIPILRSLISIPAGMSDMPFIKFLVYTICGSAIWNTLLTCVGAFAGDKKDVILYYLDRFSYLVLIILIIAFIGFLLWFYKFRNNKRVIRSSNEEGKDI